MPAPLKLGILGTSNSISSKGWVAALDGIEGVAVVANASLGSSHATLIPYRLPQLDNVKIDVLVLDVCVNEQRAVRRNLYDLEQSAEYFQFLLAWCHSNGVMPVVLILPMREDALAGGGALARYHWIKACERYSIPYFDGYTFVEHSSFYSGKPKRVFFSDSHHLTEGASAVLAKAFMRRLVEFHAKAKLKSRVGLAHHFDYASVNGNVSRKTSLFGERFARLSDGDEIEVEGRDGAVVGAVLNMAQTNGSVNFVGQGKTKRLDSAYFDPDRGLWLVAWSILAPPVFRGGAIKLRAVASEERFEGNDHAHIETLPDRSVPPVVEIAGFVVRRARKLRFMATTVGARLGLANLALYFAVLLEDWPLFDFFELI